MNWLGKIIGGVVAYLIVSNPIGVLLGVAVGHMFDLGINSLTQNQWSQGSTRKVQETFFNATFSIMGYMAKADGRVTQDEIAVAGHVMNQMQLSTEQRKAAIVLFNQGKSPDFEVNVVLRQFKEICSRRSTLIQMFIEIQIITVLADGVYHPAEEVALKDIALRMGYNPYELKAVMERVQAAYDWDNVEPDFDQNQRQQQNDQVSNASSNELDYAYSILGVERNDSHAVIKKAYRRLMSQYHPDKLVSKGLPEAMMVMAKKKAQEITRAYDIIKKVKK
ncbi:DnaJ-like protein DjlA [hydrothermal vent metagenome]|uniref:DnaJ-like protein DjlA n=1 Tax=hydrothermal vent metagenome TaxID=652676 RepID=A0A3B0Y6A3_9ZZZZ